MSAKQVAIVNTKVANIASMIAALERLGATPVLTDDSDTLLNAPYVIMPGVGAFGPGMAQLHAMNAVDAIKTRVAQNKPTFCVCLGLQLLCLDSEETPGVEGLGILDAHVVRFKSDQILIPQLGWNRVVPQSEEAGFLQEGYAYFANSYHLDRIPEGWSGAVSDHGGPFVAAVERGAILACQFHPELSGQWGLQLIKRWLEQEVTC